jgi:SPP1 gp7 family putative phage head morphogenesis protein
VSVYDSAQDYRRRLAARDAQAAALIALYYAKAWLAIRQKLRALQERMAAAEAAGQSVKPAWLFQQDSYQQLLGQVALEIDQFARLTSVATSAAQRDAIAFAIEAARELTEEQLHAESGVATGWVRLSTAAVEHLVGALASGPLHELLSPFSYRAQQAAKSALVTGVAMSENPRAIERRLQQALGITKARALTISRTEILRAHREATRTSYLANPTYVERWQWLSAMDSRTCPMCWAMTGTIHDVDEVMGTHPNCRCTQVPLPPLFATLLPNVPLADLEREAPVPSGELAFAHLSAAEQEQILGPAAYREYASGQLQLSALVGYHEHAEWGPTRYTRSLRSLGIPALV